MPLKIRDFDRALLEYEKREALRLCVANGAVHQQVNSKGVIVRLRSIGLLVTIASAVALAACRDAADGPVD